MQRERVDQPVDIPGGLSVLFEKRAHQRFLRPDVGLAADDCAAEGLADIFQVMLARLGHREVVLHAEEDGVHVHQFFEHIDLEVAVLAAGDGYRAVVAAGAVAAAVFVAQGFEFLPAGIPIDILAALVMAAGAADALGVKCDARPRVRHGAFFAILHILSTP